MQNVIQYAFSSGNIAVERSVGYYNISEKTLKNI